jgi:uncharacterized phage-associated protein
MITILDAARYLIFLSYGKYKNSLTPLKLQKILYLAQGWSYVWDNVAIFPEEFSAWKYGPVNEKVYETFKQYGKSEIPEYEGISEISDINIADTLEAVWLEFGKMTAYDLVELTHMQSPWIIAYSDGHKISNRSIQEYFQSTY